MDCAECSQHVQYALAAIPGVELVTVLLSSEKAVLRLDPTQVSLVTLHQAVAAAGYTVAEPPTEARAEAFSLARFTRPVLTLFGLLVGAVLLIVVVGEWLDFFERVTEVVPWPVGVALVLLAGAPIFWTVVRAALRRHCLRTVFDAIFYLLRNGCPWRYLPGGFPPWHSVYYHFRQFCRTGLWVHLWRGLWDAERRLVGKDPHPSAAIMDAPSV